MPTASSAGSHTANSTEASYEEGEPDAFEIHRFRRDETEDYRSVIVQETFFGSVKQLLSLEKDSWTTAELLDALSRMSRGPRAEPILCTVSWGSAEGDYEIALNAVSLGMAECTVDIAVKYGLRLIKNDNVFIGKLTQSGQLDIVVKFRGYRFENKATLEIEEGFHMYIYPPGVTEVL